MRTKIINLSPEQRQELETGYRTGENHAFRQRCHLILLKSEKSRTSKEVAELLHCQAATVGHWLKRYETQGIEGLRTRQGRGRKSIFQKEDADYVQAIVKQERQRLKLAHQTLEQHLNKRFSEKTLKRFLKHLAEDGNAFVHVPKIKQTQS